MAYESDYMSPENVQARADRVAAAKKRNADRRAGFNDFEASLYNESEIERAAEREDRTGVVTAPTFAGDNAASQGRAWLARQEWDDYQERFSPRENQFIESVNKEGALQELDEAFSQIKVNTRKASLDSSLGSYMDRSRLGVQRDAGSMVANHRKKAIDTSLSEVDAQNRTRRHVGERNMNMVGGSGARTALASYGGR